MKFRIQNLVQLPMTKLRFRLTLAVHIADKKQECADSLPKAYIRCHSIYVSVTSREHVKYFSIKALQALHDTPPLCLFLLLHMFWHKIDQCIYQI